MKAKNKFLALGLTTAATCALVGSITGTFAWYGYATRATASFHGASIDKAANLQIGIVSEDNISGLSKDEGSDNNVCWNPIGGGMPSAAIKEYLENNEYATDTMRPVTSGDIYGDLGQRIDVAPKQQAIYQYNNHDAADKDDYIVIPLALRVADQKSKKDSAEKVEYFKGMKIYLSDILVDVDKDEYEDTDIEKSIRVDFKETREDLTDPKYTLVAPGRDEDGTTELAGLLDLNEDGYADVEENDYDHNERHELVYGALKTGTTISYADAVTEKASEIADDYKYPVHLDVASHNSEINVYAVEDYEACEQDYLCADSVIADFDEAGWLKASNEAAPIATTPNSDDGIVYLTLTIWMEGWDEEGMNIESLGIPFYVDMQFQIDRVDNK